MKRTTLAAATLLVAFAAVRPPRAAAADPTPQEAQSLVAAAAQTVDSFTNSDKDLTWFRDHVKDAKGMFICSGVTKAGFIVGGSGGRCVLITKNEAGWWNGPAFYTIGSASIGFQAGVDVADIITLVMTQKAIDSLMSRELKVGGNISATAGPVGTGAGANPSTDFLVYSRSKGLYAGIDVSGAVIKPSDDYNRAYYGKPVTPIDIIAKGNVHQHQADAVLLFKVEKLYSQLAPRT